MQNKGIVWFLIVALFLACVYSLSFTFVSNHYKSAAEAAVANGEAQSYDEYMDTLLSHNESAWSLKECREKELNLGLDLRGGMNVVMEISVPDILKALAGNQASEEAFTKTIDLAKAKQKTSQKDFLTLFIEAFNEANPGGQLASIFSGYTLKNKINYTSSNDEVIKVLREEVDSAIDNSFNVLRSRIDRYGVVQPNIQKLEGSSRILIEMPGVKEPERVRKLLQGSADLAFWETTEFSEIARNIMAVNDMVAEMNKNADTLKSGADSLLADSVKGTVALFTYLKPMIDFQTGQVYPGPRVGLAHYSDTAKVTEYLNMARAKGMIPSSTFFAWTVKETGNGMYDLIALKSKALKGKERKAQLTGASVTDARADFNDKSIYAAVSMEMNQEGAKTWAKMTRENIGKCIAIVLDGYVYSYPRVNGEIAGGRSEITGDFSVNEAKDLANVLKSGKMPAPAKIVQEDVVGPSLGQEAINAGMISFVVAFALVLLYMIAYYGLIPGIVADIALICNVFLIFGVLASLKAVLTLPGIAGIVLTLGMAVDANVLIYERIREELASGKKMLQAMKDGYGNAMSAIIDANVTTILTGIILAYFGTGPIKGFATTLIIGILCSLLTAIFVTRLIFDLYSKSEGFEKLTFSTKFSENWFKNVKYDFIGKSKPYLMAAIGVIVVAVVSLFAVGLQQGIDFSGGRNYTVKFEKEVTTGEVKDLLKNAFEDANASVITIGTADQVRISTNYRIQDTDDNVDSDIESRMYNSLKPLLNNGVTEDMFVNRYVMNDGSASLADAQSEVTYGIQSSQKVGPTMADDIKISAVIAVLIAMLGIGFYIFVRFSRLAYSGGALVALAHDTLLILLLYCLLPLTGIVPFSLEVDQSFIAAILTVIGYSINDKVVIFDRIREFFRNRNRNVEFDKNAIFNSAISSTLSRTFSTSLSTLIVLVIIFFFGGDTIRGFIFAMLIGVIVGTYSSIFIAAPIACKYYSAKADEEEEARKLEKERLLADRA
ncbi:MAG: protein translocase subunit SecDF [Paludibacteraceae bacterium]|nr:protein translocase subunit SecDF [Paludibacteraceae bacterium]